MARLMFHVLCTATLVVCIDALHIRGTQQHLPSLDSSFEGKLPIEWLHVPKTGTSFMNVLLHIEGLCAGAANLPDHDPNGYDAWMGNVLPRIPSACNESALDIPRLVWYVGENSIEDAPGYDAGKGRFMTMMRQPEQRLLSHYYEQLDEAQIGCALLSLPITKCLGSLMWTQDQDMHMQNFAEQNSGLVTKMLVRSHVNAFCGSALPWEGPRSCGLPPTRTEVETSKIRLQEGFSFIGITEKWNLSICLFSAMFNQPCRSSQFRDVNPSKGKYKTSEAYDTTILNGWRDPYDNELYDLAVRIFETNLKTFNVSESSCQPCFREAGLIVASEN